MDTDPNPFRHSPDRERSSTSTEAESDVEEYAEDRGRSSTQENEVAGDDQPPATDEQVLPDGSPRPEEYDIAQPGDTPQPV